MKSNSSGKKIKNIIFFIVFALMLFASGVILYRTYVVPDEFLKNRAEVYEVPVIAGASADDWNRAVKEDIVHQEEFLELKVFGPYPISVGRTGKPNPFLYTQE